MLISAALMSMGLVSRVPVVSRESVLRVVIGASPARDVTLSSVRAVTLPANTLGKVVYEVRVKNMHGRLHNGRCVVLRRGAGPLARRIGERPS